MSNIMHGSRRVLAIVLSLVMALTVFALPQGVYAEDTEPANLLANPGFEDDYWNGWNANSENWGSSDSERTFFNTDETKIEGDKSLSFWWAYDNEVWITQYFRIEPGTYVLSGAVQGSNTTPVLYAKTDSGSAETSSMTLTGGGTWDQDSLEFTVSESDMICVGLKLEISAGGWGYIDDMKLCRKADEGGEDPDPGIDPIDPPADTTASEADMKVAINPIEGLSKDFACGVDVSSVISLENAGVKFKNNAGKEEDFFKILADAGVNYVRVRVWNNPYDADGNGYGGGNCDINVAKEIAKRAADYGMKTLVDFHYSDFWTQPNIQKAPKAWESMGLEQKCEAITTYTADCLNQIKEAGGDIGMVQIGNEISGKNTQDSASILMCDVDNPADVCKLFNAGSAAVRAFDSNVKVMIHFPGVATSANVNRTKTLQENNVDYDIVGLSWYPFYEHGDLKHLAQDMATIANTYSKPVVIAETSYPSSFDDSDGSSNTFSMERYYKSASGEQEKMIWDINPQGQAECMRALMETVSDVDNNMGLGIFYWEPAWITVGDTRDLRGDSWQAQYDKNKTLWEKYGCGWATSVAAEYSRNAEKYGAGGSSWENQAMFDRFGRATDALNVFKYVYTGAQASVDAKAITSYEKYDVTVNTAMDMDQVWGAIWKDAVKVTYSDGTSEWVKVREWLNYDIENEKNPKSIASRIKNKELGEAVVHGTLDNVANTQVEMNVTIEAANDGRGEDSGNKPDEPDDNGDVADKTIQSYDKPSISLNSKMTTETMWEKVSAKDSVKVSYVDGTSETIKVASWDKDDVVDETDADSMISRIKANKLGAAVIHGTLSDEANTEIEMNVMLQPVLKYSLNGGKNVKNAPKLKQVGKYDNAKTVANAVNSNKSFFRGWNTKKDGTGKTYIPGKTIKLTKDRTLYAKWTKYYTGKNGLKYKVVGRKKVSVVGMIKNPKTVTVPSTITVAGVKYKVASINGFAFKKCTKCTKLTIGANVTTIGKYILGKTTKTCTVKVKATNLKKADTTLRSSKSKMRIELPKKKYKSYKKILKLSKLQGTVKVVKY